MRRTLASRSLWLGLSLALPLAGCFASSSQVNALEGRMSAVERADETRRRQLSDAVDSATRQVQTLTQQLEQARAQTRNLADVGARIDGLEEQLRTINGTLSELRRTTETNTTDVTTLRSAILTQLTAAERRVTEIERRIGLAPAVDPNQIPTAPADIMTEARQAYTNRDFNRARALATALVQRAPQDPLADDARLLLGRTYVQENRYATAIQEFQHILSDYPTGDTVPDALTEMSEAFVRLGMCTPARNTLHILIDRHGGTPQGQAARQRLREVERMPRSACTG
jgi:TolA-binding protein